MGQHIESEIDGRLEELLWNCQCSFNVDLLEASRTETGVSDAIEQVLGVLKGRFLELSQEEQKAATATGLFDEQGNLIPPLKKDSDGSHRALSQSNAKLPDNADPFMIWFWDRSTANRYKNARGKEIQALVLEFTEGLQLIERSSDQEIARRMRDMGIWAFKKVGKKVFLEARASGLALLPSIKAGVVAVGGFKVIALVAIALAAIILLGIFIAKDAAGILLIANDTDEPLQWDDHESWSGRISSVFVEKPLEENPKMILAERSSEDKEDMVCGGLLSFQKKNFSTVGPHGAMGFKPTTRFKEGLKIGWDSPNTWPARNKILVSATDTGSYADFRRATYRQALMESSSLTAVGHSPQGKIRGEIYGRYSSIFSGIVYISER